MRTNWLANTFDWLGEVFEKFNPSAFRFLAALLPYLSPFPVAWLTSHSSAQFLNFTPTISYIFVFILEGMGLWFTSLFVDAVVDWIRSANLKTTAIVILFAVAVTAYIVILVNLNVTLEAATGTSNPALSKVITLICFLPLLTGIGNGYYKLKLDYKVQTQSSVNRAEEKAERERQEKELWNRQKWLLKHGFTSENNNGSSVNTSGNTNRSSKNRNGSSKNRNGSSKTGRPSIHQQRVFSYMEEMVKQNGNAPTFTEVAKDLNLPSSTASRLRNEWMQNH